MLDSGTELCSDGIGRENEEEVVGDGVVVTVVVVVIDVDVDVEAVAGVMVGGIKVPTTPSPKASAGKAGISGMIVEPRCLLSHSATAVTPSCHDS